MFLHTLGLILSDLSPSEHWDLVGEGFLVFLANYLKRDGLPLLQTTIACYLTHAASLLKSKFLILTTDLFYSRLSDPMKGLIKRDSIIYGPRRLRMKIALTYPIILQIITIAYKLYHPSIAIFIKMAILFGFLLGLRPGDYADLLKPQNGHRILAYQVYFLFDLQKDPIAACDRHLFPRCVKPLFLLVLPDNSKNAQCGDAPMRGLARNPSTEPDAPDFVIDFFDFICDDLHNPDKFQRIFSRCPIRDLRGAIVTAIKAAALVLGLPPHLMHLHGVRPAIALHLSEFSNADQDKAGGWNRDKKAIGGRLPYLRQTLEWATRVVSALYSTTHTVICKWIATALAGPPRAPITRPHTID
jgi:hypothetical protein